MINNNYDNYTSISFPKRLITNYKDLNLNELSLITLIKILSYNKRLVNIEKLKVDMNIDRNELANLSELQLITLVEQNNKIYVDLLPFYDKLSSNATTTPKSTEVLDTKSIDRLSLILNRSLKPFEIDKLIQWINEGYSISEIEIAIQKSAVNNVDNFNYIYAVLSNENKQKSTDETIKKNFDMFS